MMESGFDSVEKDKKIDAYPQGDDVVEVMIDHHANGTREYILLSGKVARQLGKLLLGLSKTKAEL